jgi:membrane-bound lytic murein transglycosylase B
VGKHSAEKKGLRLPVSARDAGRGLATSALAAVAAVALTGSQAGGALIPIEEASAPTGNGPIVAPVAAASTDDGPDFLPGDAVKDGGKAPADAFATARLTSSGIPTRAHQAYVTAARTMAKDDPGCNIPWSLLAGIGRVESDHGRYGGASIGPDGAVSPAIIGIRLDGTRAGVARIGDSDGGRLDGDAAFDRAVGPMQFLPGTWRTVSSGNPQDLDDAALAAARYLCAGGGSVGTPKGRWAAVYRYNHSDAYVSQVLGLADSYALGVPVAALPSRPSGTVTGGGGSATTGDTPGLGRAAKSAKPAKPAPRKKPAATKPAKPSGSAKPAPTKAPSAKPKPTCTPSGGFEYPSDWPTWTIPSDWPTWPQSDADKKKAAKEKAAQEKAAKEKAAKEKAAKEKAAQEKGKQKAC